MRLISVMRLRNAQNAGAITSVKTMFQKITGEMSMSYSLQKRLDAQSHRRHSKSGGVNCVFCDSKII